MGRTDVLQDDSLVILIVAFAFDAVFTTLIFMQNLFSAVKLAKKFKQ
jgi:hypothetical protein